MKKLKENIIDLLQIFLMSAAAWDIFKNRELLALCCMVLILVVEFTMKDRS
ncbi:hypothetical protein [Clostridium sp. YIM B02500]|uniref:hypothetical protein n=1 Tax=Clostridium sp. YIM B02500 TaxID=2910681 RepID=UPI001EEE2C25|nr:hypothetical protein [Clostridium sp. YIM B02500]